MHNRSKIGAGPDYPGFRPIMYIQKLEYFTNSFMSQKSLHNRKICDGFLAV